MTSPALSVMAAIAIAYVLGSIPFSYLVVMARTRQDVRQAGSGNVGATNVLRVAGKAAALLALIGDLGKGILAVALARAIAGPTAAAAAAFAAVLGHVRPLFLRSGGGKGAATGLGVLIALAPAAALMCAGVLIAVIAATRYVSLGVMIATALAPVLIIGAQQLAWVSPDGGASALAMAGIAGLILVRHRSNLQRLRTGQEPKLGERWKGQQDPSHSSSLSS